MSKKIKIAIQRDEDFTELDAELDEALGSLNAANERVAALLSNIAAGATPGLESAPQPVLATFSEGEGAASD